MIYGIYILRISDSYIEFQFEDQENNEENYTREIGDAIIELKQKKKTQEKGYINHYSKKIYYKTDDHYVFSVISDKTFSKEIYLVNEVQKQFYSKKPFKNEYLEEIRNNYSNKIKSDKEISSNNEEGEGLKKEETHPRKNNSEKSQDKNDKDNSSSQNKNLRDDSSQGSLLDKIKHFLDFFLKQPWWKKLFILIIAIIAMIIIYFLGCMAKEMFLFIFNKK